LLQYEKCIQILNGNPEKKSQFGRPVQRWEDNIELNIKEIGLKGVDWIYLAQDRD
jgi:hypothetical protein